MFHDCNRAGLRLTADLNKDLAYDRNHNGLLDQFKTGENLEIEAMGTLAGTNRVVYVKALRTHYRLSANALVSNNFVDLESAEFICPGDRLFLGPADDPADGNEYIVAMISGATIFITAPLGENHPMATHTLHKKLAGIGEDPIIVTDEGGDLMKTVAHELLHKGHIGNLRDVSVQAMDNIMFYKVGSTDTLLRRRPVDHQYSTGECGTGTIGTDEQWEGITR